MKSCELLLALDLESRSEAVKILKTIGTDLKWVKIGLQMFTSQGPDWVNQVAAMGYQVFLDLKLHHNTNTVEKAVQSLCHLPIGMLTLHSLGGVEMLTAANKVRQELKPNLLLLGVTVLTSMDKKQLNRVGVPASPQDQVQNLAGAVVESRVPGIVCSAKELKTLGPNFRTQLKFITPGIRPAGASEDDQKRIVTPAQAATLGSDYIVVGRPIYKAASPREAVQSIREDLQ